MAPVFRTHSRLAVAYVAGVNGTPGGLVTMHTDGSHPVTLVRRDVVGVSWQPLPG